MDSFTLSVGLHLPPIPTLVSSGSVEIGGYSSDSTVDSLSESIQTTITAPTTNTHPFAIEQIQRVFSTIVPEEFRLTPRAIHPMEVEVTNPIVNSLINPNSNPFNSIIQPVKGSKGRKKHKHTKDPEWKPTYSGISMNASNGMIGADTTGTKPKKLYNKKRLGKQKNKNEQKQHNTINTDIPLNNNILIPPLHRDPSSSSIQTQADSPDTELDTKQTLPVMIASSHKPLVAPLNPPVRKRVKRVFRVEAKSVRLRVTRQVRVEIMGQQVTIDDSKKRSETMKKAQTNKKTRESSLEMAKSNHEADTEWESTESSPSVTLLLADQGTKERTQPHISASERAKLRRQTKVAATVTPPSAVPGVRETNVRVSSSHVDVDGSSDIVEVSPPTSGSWNIDTSPSDLDCMLGLTGQTQWEYVKAKTVSTEEMRFMNPIYIIDMNQIDLITPIATDRENLENEELQSLETGHRIIEAKQGPLVDVVDVLPGWHIRNEQDADRASLILSSQGGQANQSGAKLGPLRSARRTNGNLSPLIYRHMMEASPTHAPSSLDTTNSRAIIPSGESESRVLPRSPSSEMDDIDWDECKEESGMSLEIDDGQIQFETEFATSANPTSGASSKDPINIDEDLSACSPFPTQMEDHPPLSQISSSWFNSIVGTRPPVVSHLSTIHSSLPVTNVAPSLHCSAFAQSYCEQMERQVKLLPIRYAGETHMHAITTGIDTREKGPMEIDSIPLPSKQIPAATDKLAQPEGKEEIEIRIQRDRNLTLSAVSMDSTTTTNVQLPTLHSSSNTPAIQNINGAPIDSSVKQTDEDVRMATETLENSPAEYHPTADVLPSVKSDTQYMKLNAPRADGKSLLLYESHSMKLNSQPIPAPHESTVTDTYMDTEKIPIAQVYSSTTYDTTLSMNPNTDVLLTEEFDETIPSSMANSSEVSSNINQCQTNQRNDGNHRILSTQTESNEFTEVDDLTQTSTLRNDLQETGCRETTEESSEDPLTLLPEALEAINPPESSVRIAISIEGDISRKSSESISTLTVESPSTTSAMPVPMNCIRLNSDLSPRIEAPVVTEGNSTENPLESSSNLGGKLAADSIAFIIGYEPVSATPSYIESTVEEQTPVQPHDGNQKPNDSTGHSDHIAMALTVDEISPPPPLAIEHCRSTIELSMDGISSVIQVETPQSAISISFIQSATIEPLNIEPLKLYETKVESSERLDMEGTRRETKVIERTIPSITTEKNMPQNTDDIVPLPDESTNSLMESKVSENDSNVNLFPSSTGRTGDCMEFELTAAPSLVPSTNSPSSNSPSIEFSTAPFPCSFDGCKMKLKSASSYTTHLTNCPYRPELSDSDRTTMMKSGKLKPCLRCGTIVSKTSMIGLAHLKLCQGDNGVPTTSNKPHAPTIPSASGDTSYDSSVDKSARPSKKRKFFQPTTAESARDDTSTCVTDGGNFVAPTPRYAPRALTIPNSSGKDCDTHVMQRASKRRRTK